MAHGTQLPEKLIWELRGRLLFRSRKHSGEALVSVVVQQVGEPLTSRLGQGRGKPWDRLSLMVAQVGTVVLLVCLDIDCALRINPLSEVLQ